MKLGDVNSSVINLKLNIKGAPIPVSYMTDTGKQEI